MPLLRASTLLSSRKLSAEKRHRQEKSSALPSSASMDSSNSCLEHLRLQKKVFSTRRSLIPTRSTALPWTMRYRKHPLQHSMTLSMCSSPQMGEKTWHAHYRNTPQEASLASSISRQTWNSTVTWSSSKSVIWRNSYDQSPCTSSSISSGTTCAQNSSNASSWWMRHGTSCNTKIPHASCTASSSAHGNTSSE